MFRVRDPPASTIVAHAGSSAQAIRHGPPCGADHGSSMFPLAGRATPRHERSSTWRTRANERRTSSDREHGRLAGWSAGGPPAAHRRRGGSRGRSGRQRGRDHRLMRRSGGRPGAGAVPVHRARVRGPAPPAVPHAVHCRLRPHRRRGRHATRRPRRQQPAVLHRGGLGPRRDAPHGLRPEAAAPGRRLPSPRVEPSPRGRGDGARAAHARSRRSASWGSGRSRV